MDSVFVAVVILMFAGGLVGFVALVKRNGTVPMFDDVPPGVIPRNPDAHPTRLVPVKQLQPNPPPPRFNPPDRMLPWMTGGLSARGAGGRDFGALLVDLAVAGYIRIDRDPTASKSRRKNKTDWMLTKTAKDASHLQGAPRDMMWMVFPQGEIGAVTGMDAVGRRAKSGTGKSVRDAMNADSEAAIGAGARGDKHPVRTALIAQTEQFRQYLKTAEVNQIRVDEAASIFSRYLPWAIALGEAEHWAKVFRDVTQSVGGDGFTSTDAVIIGTWGHDLAWFGGIDFSGFDSGMFDGIGGLADIGGLGAFADGIGDFGSSMDGFGSDLGGSSGGGWSSCSSSSCSSGASCGGSSCGSSCGGS